MSIATVELRTGVKNYLPKTDDEILPLYIQSCYEAFDRPSVRAKSHPIH